MRDKFHNHNGDLSRYALACGYVQKHQTEDYTIELYMEHTALHVRRIPAGGSVHDPMGEWDVFDHLTEARKKYNELIARSK